jgi:hypothetical protein
MHKWLPKVDGLDDEWEQGKSSAWQGELGQFEEVDRATQQAFALHQLWTGLSFRNFNLSGMGARNDFLAVNDEILLLPLWEQNQCNC